MLYPLAPTPCADLRLCPDATKRLLEMRWRWRADAWVARYWPGGVHIHGASAWLLVDGISNGTSLDRQELPCCRAFPQLLGVWQLVKAGEQNYSSAQYNLA